MNLLIFSLFGPASFQQLHEAFAEQRDTHAYHFFDMHDVGDLLLTLGMTGPVMESYWPEVKYRQVSSVMRDLRLSGAQYASRDRRRGLMGKHEWQQAMRHLEAQKQAGVLTLPLEIPLGHAWWNGEQNQARDRAQATEVRVPVSQLQRRQDGESE